MSPVPRKLAPPRGLIRPAEWPHGIVHARYHAPPDLAEVVEHFWFVDWDLLEHGPWRQHSLPHPTVHVTVEGGRGTVTGVPTRRFERVLEGRGRVMGIKFRPGTFSAVCPRPVSMLAGRVVDVDTMFAEPGRELVRASTAAREHAEAVEHGAAFVRALAPALDEAAVLARTIAERIAVDRTLNKVDDVARTFDTTLRALQRLFARHVGATPKWVIQRYRIHEALARADAGTKVDWAALALELGYFDQPHFVRDFRRLVGVTPTAYR